MTVALNKPAKILRDAYDDNGLALRDAAGRALPAFHRHSAARFQRTHEMLRQTYKPPQVIESEEPIAGCGVSETAPANASAGQLPASHPSFSPIRIAQLGVGIIAGLALGFAPEWAPENGLVRATSSIAIFGAGWINIVAAMAGL